MNAAVRTAAVAIVAGTLSAPADSVEKVATMRNPRSVHTVTTLASGRVLIAGGMTNGGGALATAEVFDPARNTTEAIAPMNAARHGHTATLLADGRVVVAGGYDGTYLASVEIYDPRSNRFTRAGEMTEERSGQTATLLPDGKILFTGGVGRGWTFLASAELYDPATGRSVKTGAMASPRASQVATLLVDGRVLIVGGHNGRRQNMQVYASAEVYSPQTGRFEAAGAMNTPRHKHDAIRLSDGRVLVIGGADRTDRRFFSTTEIFDPRTTRFTAGPSMANERYKIAGTSVLLPTGEVLVTGGARRVEILDADRNQFREVPGSLPEGFQFAASAPLPNGDVLIAGGYAGAIVTTDGVWRFRRR